MKTYLKPVAFGFLGCLLAIALFVVGYHTYVDHTIYHQLVNIEVERQKAAQKPATP